MGPNDEEGGRVAGTDGLWACGPTDLCWRRRAKGTRKKDAMKRMIGFVSIFAGLALVGGCQFTEATAVRVYSVPPEGEYAVIHIVDGDTLDIGVPLADGALLKQRVRLLGIDTPERGESGFKEATDELRARAGTRVHIRYATDTKQHRDKYGRLLCWIKRTKP